MITRTPWEPTYKRLVGGVPGQPARYGALVEHLQRDRAGGRLTLKGPDLAYYAAFAAPDDDLREWVMARLDERIAAADAARLDAESVGDRHICVNCHGLGCSACQDTGFVCPTCRGHRFLADGPIGAQQGKVIPCPDCTVAGPPGRRRFDAHREAVTIQRYITGRRVGGHTSLPGA